MTSRLVRSCLAALGATLALPAFAQPPAPAPAAVPNIPVDGPDVPVQLQLPDVDIDTVIQTLELFTGRSVLRPTQLPVPVASFNLRIKTSIPKSEAILAIETVLALNGIGVAPMGDRFLVITPLALTKTSAPEMITGSAFDQPPSGKIALKIFQLEFIRVQELQQFLPGILNPNLAGGFVPLIGANAIMITDSVNNLQRVEALLQRLDRPNTAGLTPKFYTLRNGAKASDLVQKIRTILGGTLTQQLGQATSFSADDRSNQIVLVTDPRQYPIFDELIERLDVKSDPNTRNEVIYLKHAKAVEVVTVLSKIISTQTQAAQRQNPQSVRPGQGAPPPVTPLPAAPPIPGAPNPATPPSIVSGSSAGNGNEGGTNEFSQLMTVVNDDRSNSVVVSGTVDDIRLIRDLIDKLDIVLPQVRIEVVIAEVTLDDNHSSGFSQLGLKLDGDKLIGFSATEATFGIANGVITRPGLSGPFDLAAEISVGITPRKTNTTILTVPAIVTSHGKEGIINDGETRPVISGVTTIPGAASGATTSSQVTQQDIGTMLTVTPFIGSDGSVTLDIKQQLTDVIGNVAVDNNTQYIIGKRNTTSTISAKSGEIRVLGGFRKQVDSKSTNRLGPIPFLGDLFGKRTRDKYYQELIFFLRPTVLTQSPTTDDAETMSRVEQLPTRDQIKQQLDPKYVAPHKSIIDQILPR